MNYAQQSLEAHERHHGKWAVTSKMPLDTKDDLSIAYTPGVAEPCRAIAADKTRAMTLTMKGNAVAVVSDGSSVLGLGNIGPEAGLPVMEGKAVLYKKYADIDAVPIVLASQNVDDIVHAVTMIAPTFGGIHLEDIAAPACFAVERRLAEALDIPVMHDDQHATAIVTVAALTNALRVVGKDVASVRVVVNGAGAAGIAIAKLLHAAGVNDIVLLDSKGVVHAGRNDINGEKAAFVALGKNLLGVTGGLADALAGADVFIGVSKPNLVSQDMVRSMAPSPVVFALANPDPEMHPDDARAAGAAVVATGRSDFPNQVNNVLVYPGLFRGLFDTRRKLDDVLRLAAARALAAMVPHPTADTILPSILETNPAPVIAKAVADV